MDFKQLEYILKIAELGNLTKAAEELYITQPALSHFIAKVEKEQGVKLFNRSTTPITLTYAGEKYVEKARQILELSSQLDEEMEEIGKNRKGRLRIGIPPARATYMMPAFFPAFKKEFPNIEIQTDERSSHQLKLDVIKGNVDYAIMPEVGDLKDFRCIDLFEEELFLVAKKGCIAPDEYNMDQQGRKIIKIDKLAGHKFILLKKGHGIRDALDVIFKMNGFKPDILMETTNNPVAFCMAAAGEGLAVVPEITIKLVNTREAFDIFKLSEAGVRWTICAIVNQNDQISEIENESLRIVKELFDKQKQ